MRLHDKADSEFGEELSDREDLFRFSADVIRNHTWPTLRNQTVGQHTFNMLVLLGLITGDTHRGAVARAVRDHDLHEVFTGDAPATVKWEVPGMREVLDESERMFNKQYGIQQERNWLQPEEICLVKFIDMYEFGRYCLDERRLGNQHADLPFGRAIDAINKLGHTMTWGKKTCALVEVLELRYMEAKDGSIR